MIFQSGRDMDVDKEEITNAENGFCIHKKEL